MFVQICIEGSYATNKFIHTPRFDFIAGENIQPDCSENEKDYYL